MLGTVANTSDEGILITTTNIASALACIFYSGRHHASLGRSILSKFPFTITTAFLLRFFFTRVWLRHTRQTNSLWEPGILYGWDGDGNGINSDGALGTRRTRKGNGRDGIQKGAMLYLLSFVYLYLLDDAIGVLSFFSLGMVAREEIYSYNEKMRCSSRSCYGATISLSGISRVLLQFLSTFLTEQLATAGLAVRRWRSPKPLVVV